jgi:DNA-binding NarL/FixJ family response regulator
LSGERPGATLVPEMHATSDGTVRVLTVDDQAIFRGALRDVIEATPGFEALGEAASGAEALRISAALDPDLVLMDVRMPGMDGIETARRLREIHARAIIVLISLDFAANVERRARDCGAVALLRKEDFCPGELQRVWNAHRPG